MGSLFLVSGQLLFKETKPGQVDFLNYFSPAEDPVQHCMPAGDDSISGIFQGMHEVYVCKLIDQGLRFSGFSQLPDCFYKEGKIEAAVSAAIGAHIDPPPLRRVIMGYLAGDASSAFFNESFKKETPVVTELKKWIKHCQARTDAVSKTLVAAADSKGEFKQSAAEKILVQQGALLGGLKKLCDAVSDFSDKRYSDRVEDVFREHEELRVLAKKDNYFADLIREIKKLDPPVSKPRPG